MLIFRMKIVLLQHLVSSLSLGDCSVHRLREDSRNTFITFFYMFRAVLYSSSGGQTVLIQHLVSSLWKHVTCLQSDDTRCIPDAVLIQFVLLKMNIIVLETCREYSKCIKIKNLCIKLVKNRLS